MTDQPKDDSHGGSHVTAFHMACEVQADSMMRDLMRLVMAMARLQTTDPEACCTSCMVHTIFGQITGNLLAICPDTETRVRIKIDMEQILAEAFAQVEAHEAKSQGGGTA